MNLNKIFLRQQDLVKPKDLEFPILIIGAGGIGSWTTLALAKLGCADLTVVDFDRVEDKNIPSQLYRLEQKDSYKTIALRDSVKYLTDVEIKVVNKLWKDFYLKDSFSYKVVVCAVDSIETRKEIFYQLMDDWQILKHFKCFIDARMGGELMRVLTVNPHDNYSVEYYKSKLFASKNVSHEPCTGRSIVYNTLVCSGLVANQIKKFAKKEQAKFDISFDLGLMDIV